MMFVVRLVAEGAGRVAVVVERMRRRGEKGRCRDIKAIGPRIAATRQGDAAAGRRRGSAVMDRSGRLHLQEGVMSICRYGVIAILGFTLLNWLGPPGLAQTAAVEPHAGAWR